MVFNANVVIVLVPACLQAATESSLLAATVGVSPGNVAATAAGTVGTALTKRTVVRSL